MYEVEILELLNIVSEAILY